MAAATGFRDGIIQCSGEMGGLKSELNGLLAIAILVADTRHWADQSVMETWSWPGNRAKTGYLRRTTWHPGKVVYFASIRMKILPPVAGV